MNIVVPVSIGELVDKITILRIKSRRIEDQGKLKNIRLELDSLLQVCREQGIDASSRLALDLEAINEELWDIEDRIRDKERSKTFDADFIALARSVYVQNDKRFAVKSQINTASGSTLKEEKSYKPY